MMVTEEDKVLDIDTEELDDIEIKYDTGRQKNGSNRWKMIT